MSHKYEIYKDARGEYRVRFKNNSEVIWSTEGYNSKKSAINVIDSVRNNLTNANIEDSADDIENLKTRLENAPIPAADRVVRLDHNSSEFKEFKAAFEKLEESIRKSNDFGDMTSEDIEVAKSEISEIDSEKKGRWIRPEHIWLIAKSTLLWIANKAAEAAVGTIALYVLEALAKLLRIM